MALLRPCDPGAAVVPTSPKGRCRVCKQLHCTDPKHARQPRQRTQASVQRPTRNTWPERKRRAAIVSAWLSVHGRALENGDVIARCPDCRQMKRNFVADHVLPLAQGGSEDGELRVHCASCSGRQGARLAALRRQRQR